MQQMNDLVDQLIMIKPKRRDDNFVIESGVC